MKKVTLVLAVLVMFVMSSCSWINPSYTKSETEKKQYKEMKVQTELMRTANTYDSLRVELLKEQNEILRNRN